MQKLRSVLSGRSPIAVTALLSVLVLATVSTVRIVALVRPNEPNDSAPMQQTAAADTVTDPTLQQQMLLLGIATSTDMDATSSTDHLSLIGPIIAGELLGTYSAIHDNGDYTKDDLRNAAGKIAEYMKAAVTYDAFDNSDFKTDSNNSTERVKQYRDELLTALKPLDSIDSAEYEIYGRYVETSDKKYLVQLKDTANLYRQAANAASTIVVPSDAINYHRDVLNSLRAFASVLDGLADHADDPFASVALLRTYNEKEQDIHDSYNHMRSYYAKKQL